VTKQLLQFLRIPPKQVAAGSADDPKASIQ